MVSMGRLVEIARYYDPEEAFCAQGYLRSCGIDTLVQNEHHLSMNPSLRVALGGYGLFGLAGDAEEAKSVLAMVGSEAGALSSDSEGENRRKWYWTPVAIVSGVPFFPRCKSMWGLFLLMAPGGLLWLAYLFNLFA